MSVTRDFALDDAIADEKAAAYQLRVINEEDSPMLYAVDNEMDGVDLMELGPVILPCDAGALQVRRRIRKICKREEALRSIRSLTAVT